MWGSYTCGPGAAADLQILVKSVLWGRILSEFEILVCTSVNKVLLYAYGLN
jgi:hypothetical protein